MTFVGIPVSSVLACAGACIYKKWKNNRNIYQEANTSEMTNINRSNIDPSNQNSNSTHAKGVQQNQTDINDGMII
ncbi:hypothetical protein [Candidatus Deianiraea vastatrix]|uniref:Uncharacterized protein n=1 Tax=Candidatus Deianiraea vastatrix TaxID=2163644 RepID=A0A5B8XGS5_9RICK|nr:hypothetical protein [Candidatus Deianiraea vastatrix]QED23097.1 hypothetical protein Deia_00290 [Candidatus Deianiraea vastatrix]